MHSDRTKGNRHKLEHGEFQLVMCKKFHCGDSETLEQESREAGASLLLVIFKTQQGPESKLSCDSMILWLKVWNI